MYKDRTSYCIDGSGRAIDFKTAKVFSERAIIDNFNNYCANDNVTDAFCQVDRDSDEQVKEGMTTYGVKTKDSKLITIAIHENNYAACKDQMAILGSSVKKAEEKISNNRKKIGRTLAIAGFTVVVFGTLGWAGKIKLDDWFKNRDKSNDKTIESSTETTTEPITEFATPIDATTEDYSEINKSAEEIRNSIEESNKVETKRELEELAQNREELGLNPDSVTPIENETKESNYRYQDIYDNAEKTQAVIDEYNQYETERQQQELQDLRKSYEDEYKVKTY